VGAFESAWSSEGFLTREHEERMQEQGREALRKFVARDAATSVAPLAVETEFKFKVGDDVVIGRWTGSTNATSASCSWTTRARRSMTPEKASRARRSR